MATVGSVMAVLQGLDPSLPIGALRVERSGEITSFEVDDVIEMDVVHHQSSGQPLAAWVVTGLKTVATPEVLFEAVPSTWTITRPCGCIMPVPVRPGRRVTTLAVPCPHYKPSSIAVGHAELHAPEG